MTGGVMNLHMNIGNGSSSYATNSLNQKLGILKTWHILEETLKMVSLDPGFSKCLFRMADLGCSSGPNTLLVTSRVIEIIRALCVDSIEFQVFLNDLPDNDFNNLFSMLPDFYHKLDNSKDNMGRGTRCFVSGLPGSFYGRLFPRESMNFVWSSYSLQWLSQVPERLESNRNNIHMSMTSPQEVIDAYARQYKRDFMTFLISRSEEMMPGGYMVLTFVGRTVEDISLHEECMHFTILANTLVDMANEGLVKEAELYSFNLPIYTPTTQEVEELILIEGSFNLEKLEGFQVYWDEHVRDGCGNRYDKVDTYTLGEQVSIFIRAYTEPVVANHFGDAIVDELYKRYGMKLAEYLSKEDPVYFIMMLCLSRKAKK
ncbi:benzoate carboxyl methyltransferase-like [Andrographis paniculata]|uniref:benzoate carboxyl methyltransferase-like n=1 Tax=Andrographis paniculata TaxID=175694 RepID=UPI0021E7B6A1|nr:benzoate carboxyl methyltransferase-like [Andrographis paniculata]